LRPDALVFGIAGVVLGLITGWLIGSHQDASLRSAAAPVAQTPAAPGPAAAPATPPPALNDAEVARYKELAERDPANATPRTQLGNLYFDAERYDEAIRWYEQALQLDPTNADVSTDLGVSYYYQNQPDRALAQFKRSLEIDPRHTKTMLNEGIVLAFGKQDLDGAARVWQRVVELAPDSPEGKAARRALDSMKAAHPNLGGATEGSSN
jgi:tetratricopeptide (TPR) repeat protein